MSCSPLGRGFLTARVRRAADYQAASDFRAAMPRLRGDNVDRNMRLVERVQDIVIVRHEGRSAPVPDDLRW